MKFSWKNLWKKFDVLIWLKYKTQLFILLMTMIIIAMLTVVCYRCRTDFSLVSFFLYFVDDCAFEKFIEIILIASFFLWLLFRFVSSDYLPTEENHHHHYYYFYCFKLSNRDHFVRRKIIIINNKTKTEIKSLTNVYLD